MSCCPSTPGTRRRSPPRPGPRRTPCCDCWPRRWSDAQAATGRSRCRLECSGRSLASSRRQASRRPPRDAMTGCSALVVVGRGPALSAADYGALILKETAAIAAECLAGGSFRHGPLEVAGAAVGVVVLAPTGPTSGLCSPSRRGDGRPGQSHVAHRRYDRRSCHRHGSAAGDDAPCRRRGVRATDHERPHPASRGHPGPGTWSCARPPAALAEGHRSRVTTTWRHVDGARATGSNGGGIG